MLKKVFFSNLKFSGLVWFILHDIMEMLPGLKFSGLVYSRTSIHGNDFLKKYEKGFDSWKCFHEKILPPPPLFFSFLLL